MSQTILHTVSSNKKPRGRDFVHWLCISTFNDITLHKLQAVYNDEI